MSAKTYTGDYQEHENIKDRIDKTDSYELDKFGLDVSNKEWRKRAFGSELENIYDMKILKGMNYTNDNKVNNISDCISLYHILNSSKHTK